MNEFKGTPGPWRSPKGSMTLFIDAAIGGGVLQEVAACGPTDNPSHQAHNARLIAAAPELLEALQEVVAISDRKHEAWDKAHAAIAKALGETE